MILDEGAIEQNLIDLLQMQGYTYFNDSTINPTSDNPQREKRGRYPLPYTEKTMLRCNP